MDSTNSMEFVGNINNVNQIEYLQFHGNYSIYGFYKITYLGDLESIFHLPLDHSGM